MIEKYVKRGVMASKARKFVTTIEIPYGDKVATAFFIDADRNLINPYSHIKARLLDFLKNNESLKFGMLQSFVRALDEDAIKHDYVVSDMIVVVEQGDDKFVITVGASGMLVYVYDHWAFDVNDNLSRGCEFENGGSKFHYIGSGAAIGAEQQYGKHEDLLLITMDTLLHFKDSCDLSITSNFFYRTQEVTYPQIFDRIQALVGKEKYRTSKDMFVAAVYSKLDLSQNNEEIDLN